MQLVRHLVNFLGTDTVASMICARDYYGAKKAIRIELRSADRRKCLQQLCRQQVDLFQPQSTLLSHLGALTVKLMP